MSEQEWPEWAKEFEGWEYQEGALRMEVERGLGPYKFTAYKSGMLYIRLYGNEMEFSCKEGPEAALRVANAIAKELGGWPGEEA